MILSLMLRSPNYSQFGAACKNTQGLHKSPLNYLSSRFLYQNVHSFVIFRSHHLDGVNTISRIKNRQYRITEDASIKHYTAYIAGT